MMMISPKRNSRVFFVLFGAAALALAVGAAVLLRNPLGSLVWQAASPLFALRNAAGASEANKLRAELASTTAALADRDFLYRENLDLKARLGRNAARQVILAGVLERPAGVPYDTLVLDAGSAEGVAVGQLVAAAGSALIGRVDEVHTTTARVVLFSSPGQEYTALINSLTPVSLAGQGGGSLRGEVPAGTEVSVGDPLVIMGIGGGLMAEVSAVEQKEGQSFVAVYAHLLANPQELRFVEIWK